MNRCALVEQTRTDILFKKKMFLDVRKAEGQKRKTARSKKTRKSGTRRRDNAFFDALPTERQHAHLTVMLAWLSGLFGKESDDRES